MIPGSDLILRLAYETQQMPGMTTAPDIARVRSIPLNRTPTPFEVEQVNYYFLTEEAYHNGFRLLKDQHEALFQLGTYRKMFSSVCVGGGKTGIALLTAGELFRWGVRKVVQFAPPRCIPQLLSTDIKYWRKRAKLHYRAWDFTVPAPRRAELAKRTDGLFVLPTSLLQNRTDARSILEAIDADAVIIDEAHWLKNPQRARTKRLSDWLEARGKAGRPVMVFPLTGTISTRSIMEYHHQAAWALGDQMFLPRSAYEAKAWAAVIDSRTAPTHYEIMPLAGLLLWARDNAPKEEGPFDDTQEGCRRAYYSRASRCPGVVISTESSCDATIVVRPRVMPNPRKEGDKGWAAVEHYINEVENMRTPDGDEIAHAMHKWRWLYQLSYGFFMNRVWPEVDALAERLGCPSTTAADILHRSKELLAFSNHYRSSLRDWLKQNARAGMDTPFLVGQDMMRHHAQNVGEELYYAWRLMKDKEHPDLIERDSIVQWLSYAKLEAAAKWALARPTPSGIIFYQNKTFGSKLREFFEHYNIPHFFGPASADADRALLEPEKLKGKFLLLSVRAHGTGKNLQFTDATLFAQWPESSGLVEQAIGRTHRPMQESDEITVDLNMVTEFEEEHLSVSIIDALYMRQAHAQRWKMMSAVYEPTPRVFPPEVLRQRGHDVNLLSPEQREYFLERFAGSFSLR